MSLDAEGGHPGLSATYLLRLVLLGVVISGGLVASAVWWEITDIRHHFEREATATADLVSQRLSESEAVLSGLTALYHAVDEVDREQFSLYASEMLARYPHIAYIEYQERVALDEVSSFEAGMQAEGYLNYRLWEERAGQKQPVSARPFYYPVVIVEPLEPEQAQLLGFDVYSDAIARRAIDRAIRSGEVSASAPYTLPNGIQVYSLYKAVYSSLHLPQGETQKFAQARRIISLLVKPHLLLQKQEILTANANVVLSYEADGGMGDILRVSAENEVGPLLEWLLPQVHFAERLDGDGQPFLISIDKQLGSEVLRLGVLTSIVVFSLLLVVIGYMRVHFVRDRAYNRAQLRQQRDQEDVTLHAIADAVITTDVEGRVERMNATAEALTGWPLSEARGRALWDVLPLQDKVTAMPIDNPVSECLQEGRAVRLGSIVILHNRQNEEFFIMANASPIRDQTGQVIAAVLVFHDVSEEHQMQEALKYQASHDALTGLIDRGAFENQLAEALATAENSGQQHALCYMDLDQFKVVNDACGHVAGDELLVQLSALLLSEVRDTDVLARLGGDEFAILLKNCPLDLAVSKTESLLDVIRAFRFVWQGKRFDVGFGVGIVAITENSGSIEDLLRAADVACYAAKSKGRNQIFVYQANNPELERHRGEMRWATRIGEALEKQQFQIYYQTIRSLSGEPSEVFHCELLMRRKDESSGLTSPEEFIPAAERFNLMPDIDRWVVDAALPKIAELVRLAAERGERVLCGINLSGQSLGDETFFAYVDALIDRHAVPTEAICFEVTETSAISNFEVALRFIERMRARGCRFALDDFGTGVSSFSYLKRLPLDYVKIDGSFVRDLLDNPVDEAMVASINKVAHALNIETIAEYVESEALLERLRELGTDYAQGYLIAQPAPLDERLSGQAKLSL